MKRWYICEKCVRDQLGRRLSDLTAHEFNNIKGRFAFKVRDGEAQVCPKCGGRELRKLFGLLDTYVVGYGFADKAGARRDMDLHAMATGADPYKSHRKDGEAQDVMLRLQREREGINPKVIRLGV